MTEMQYVQVPILAGIPEVFLLLANKLNEDPVLTAFTSILRDDHGLMYAFFCLFSAGIVRLIVFSCFRTQCKYLGQNKSRCRFAFFFSTTVLAHTMKVYGLKAFKNNLIEGAIIIHVFTLECFCHQLFSLLEQRSFCRLCKARDFGICLHYDLIGCLHFQEKVIKLCACVEVIRYRICQQADFRSSTLRTTTCGYHSRCGFVPEQMKKLTFHTLVDTVGVTG